SWSCLIGTLWLCAPFGLTGADDPVWAAAAKPEASQTKATTVRRPAMRFIWLTPYGDIFDGFVRGRGAPLASNSDQNTGSPGATSASGESRITSERTFL